MLQITKIKYDLQFWNSRRNIHFFYSNLNLKIPRFIWKIRYSDTEQNSGIFEFYF